MSSDNSVIDDAYKERVQELVQHVETGDQEQLNRVIDEITNLREGALFQELGKLTREFHEALNAFRLDARIASFAEQEFPDARERLKYVITMTAQAADRSLTAVEKSTPVCDKLSSDGEELKALWARFTSRDMEAAEFRELSNRLTEFFEQLPHNAEELKTNFNEITMAQDFQDLTGQIITRVIALVDDIESNLVELIRISGGKMGKPPEQPKKEKDESGDVGVHGPAVPGVDDASELVSGQDDVDDLLSSLGF